MAIKVGDTVYSVKSCLVKGSIHQIKVTRLDTNGGIGAGGSGYHHPREWAETPKEALEKADALRLKKIANLKKQIEKLQAIKFEVPK